MARASYDCDLLLGIDPDVVRRPRRRRVPRGPTVILYTDGLVERRGEHIDAGLARVIDVLVDIGPDTTLEQLCDRSLQRRAAGDPDDDVA